MPGKKHARKRAGDEGHQSRKAAKKRKQDTAEDGAMQLSDGSDLDVGEDDVEFVDEYAGRLGFLKGPQIKEQDSALTKSHKVQKEKPPQQKVDTLERGLAHYEEAPRKRLAEQEADNKGRVRLPVKTAGGAVVYEQSDIVPELPKVHAKGITITDAAPTPHATLKAAAAVAEPQNANDHDHQLESDSDEGEELAHPVEVALPQPPGMGTSKVTAAERHNIRQQIATAATKLMHEPETHGASLRFLVGLASSNDDKVSGLAMLSLAAVFKDILPGYRIRPPTDKEQAMSVSKEVRKLRDHENLLLSSYQAYLKQLLKAANSKRPGGDDVLVHARVGVRCMCLLLASLHHFNYASDLLQAIVPRMAHHDAGIAAECQQALRMLLLTDASGGMMREAVQLVADLVRVRKCHVPAEVVRVLLSLELAEAEAPGSAQPGKAERLSHKARKRRKKAKADEVSAAFKEADARADAAERRAAQSQTLEALLEIFFRVLKQCAGSGLLKPGAPQLSGERMAAKFPLLQPSLEGLVRWGHAMSIEYFGDLLGTLQALLASPRLPLPQRLHLLLTASSLLKGQGESLTVDRRGLFEALFYALGTDALAPLADTSDSLSTEEQRQQDEATALLVQTGSQMLLEQARALDISRMAAFSKRLCLAALFVGPAAAMGLLAILDRLLRRSERLRAALEVEPQVGGPPRPHTHAQGSHAELLDAAASSARGEGLWEVTLLKRHHHPHVAAAATSIANTLSEGGGSCVSSVLAMPAGPSAVASAYMQGGGAPLPGTEQRGRSRGSVKQAATQHDRDCMEETRELLHLLYSCGLARQLGAAGKHTTPTAAYVRLCGLAA